MTATTSESSENQPSKLPRDPTAVHTEIGEILQVERLRQERTVADVATHLHLSSLIVGDLEAGRFDRLAVIYRRGYIANYARFLKLDPEPLLAKLGSDEPPQLRQVLPTSQRAWKFDRFLKIATYALVTTVIIPPLVIIYIQGGSRMMERSPADSTEQASAVDSVANPDSQRASKRIARALAMDEPAASGLSGHVNASALPLSAVRPLREQGASTVEPGANSDTDTEPAAVLATGDESRRQLRFQVEEDSWVELYAGDGVRLEYDLLRAGQERSYEGQAPFRVLLGRARAVNVFLDGEPVVYDGHDRADVAQFELLATGEARR